jgi:hypothetical protein
LWILAELAGILGDGEELIVVYGGVIFVGDLWDDFLFVIICMLGHLFDLGEVEVILNSGICNIAASAT